MTSEPASPPDRASLWSWLKRLLVTGAVLATVPFLVPPRMEAPGLGPVLSAVHGAWRPLTVIALAGAAVLALTLAWSRGRRGGRDLAVFVGCGALSVATLLRVEAPTGEPGSFLFAGTPMGGVAALAWVVAAAGILRFAATFPAPTTLDDVNRAMAFGDPDRAPPPSRTVRAVWWVFRRAWPLAGVTVAGLTVTWWVASAETSETVFSITWSVVNVPMLLAVALLPRVHHKAEGEKKRQTLWVATGLSLGLMNLPVLGLLGSLIPAVVSNHPVWQVWADTGGLLAPLLALGGIVFVVCLAIAVFGQGLFDPRLVLRPSVVYGFGGLLALFLFAVLEEAAQSLVVDQLGVGSQLWTWIAGAMAALAFGPIRHWLKRATENWLGADSAVTGGESRAAADVRR